jgi:hypothetical protein
MNGKLLTPMRLVGRKERKDAKVQRRKGSGSRGTIKKLSGDFPCSVVGCAAKAASLTLRKSTRMHLPQPLGSARFQPGGRYFSAGVRKPPDPGNNKTILFFLDAPASFFNTSHLDIYSV